MTVVDNREPKWDDGEGWSASLEPHVSIGGVDGPQEYQWFDVTAAARQSDGDIVVVDGGSREVRLYDRLGIFMRNLGGPGSGPGEFQDPAQVMVTAGDSVVVWDNTLYRITRFDPDGGFVSVGYRPAALSGTCEGAWGRPDLGSPSRKDWQELPAWRVPYSERGLAGRGGPRGHRYADVLRRR